MRLQAIQNQKCIRAGATCKALGKVLHKGMEKRQDLVEASYERCASAMWGAISLHITVLFARNRSCQPMERT
jgi:hypothetical protein